MSKVLNIKKKTLLLISRSRFISLFSLLSVIFGQFGVIEALFEFVVVKKDVIFVSHVFKNSAI